MLSLPSDLDKLCFTVFSRCDELENGRTLRDVFTTTELAPFADGLPERTGTKRAFVNAAKSSLLKTHLADGRALMLPFLDALCGYCVEADALYDELHSLRRQMVAHVQAVKHPLALNHIFIGYAPADGKEHAQRLHAALLEAGLRPWLDVRHTPPDCAPDAAREEALRECAAVLLILTPGSADAENACAKQLQFALRYKKPVFPLRVVPGVDAPPALGRRPVMDFTNASSTRALAPAVDALRRALDDLTTPAGQVRELEYRLADAERELDSAPNDPRILADVAQLEADLRTQRAVARDPQAAARAAEKRTEAALERERQPERPMAGHASTKFINPPPLIAPIYFQDRHVENRLIGDFLRDPARRVLTVVGRAGVGKTAMVCRLLKALESGHLPDDLGELRLSGIVYLSAVGSRRISFPNLFEDLLKLLPADQRPPLEALYKDPQQSVAAKLRPVLAAFDQTVTTPVVVLLDNLEDLLDPATHAFADAEVDAALRALLEAPPHPVKVLLTTRLTPHGLPVLHPERQMHVPLDAGLEPQYAEVVLRAGDPLGVLGLKDAPSARLTPACEYTRGYPRALEALAAALNADRSTTLEELLAGDPPENVVEALVGQAFSRLDPLAQKVMQGLAVFGRPVPPAAVDYLLQPHLPGLDSAPILNRLVNARFVAKESGRYYMHPVDRAYAFARLSPGDDTPTPHSLLFTPPSLLSRAADYFRATRAPRAEWKTLADLTPHLAEIDLRCAANDYDAAARVLLDIDYDYLLLWGHYRLMIDQHERLQGKLSDARLKRISVGNLGQAYQAIGQIPQAIACQEQALEMAREAKNRQAEGVWLGNLGNCYADLGQTRRAIEFYEQALAIAREIGDRRTEGNQLGNLGNRYAELGQTRRAIEFYEQALAIHREIGDRRGEGADLGNLGWCYGLLGDDQRSLEYYELALVNAREIGNRYGEAKRFTWMAQILIDQLHLTQALSHLQESVKIGAELGSPEVNSETYYFLALAHHCTGDLPAARIAAQEARRYDVPQNNANVLALLGVIAAQQGDVEVAREAFTAALVYAEELLALTPENVAALDAQTLALAGLGEIEAAHAAYQAARAVNSDAGVVQRATRLLGQVPGIEPFW